MTATLDNVVQAYNAIRDARTARRHKYEAEDLELENQQLTLKRFMLDLLNKNGAQSIKTAAGTVFRSERTKVSGADWSAIWDWAKANDAMDIFERRLKATFINEYAEANGGAVPPGINVHREFEVSVRRPSASSKDE